MPDNAQLDWHGHSVVCNSTPDLQRRSQGPQGCVAPGLQKGDARNTAPDMATQLHSIPLTFDTARDVSITATLKCAVRDRQQPQKEWSADGQPSARPFPC